MLEISIADDIKQKKKIKETNQNDMQLVIMERTNLKGDELKE